MPGLADVLGGLIGQIDRGRSQADLASVEVANVYRNHPLLRAFPVPKIRLDQLELDLKLAFASPPAGRGIFTPQARARVLDRISTLLRELPEAEPDLRELLRPERPDRPESPGPGPDRPERPETERRAVELDPEQVWGPGRDDAQRRIGDVLPTGVEADAVSLAAAASTIVRGALLGSVVRQEAQVPIARVRAFIARQADEFEDRLREQLRVILEEEIARERPGDGGLEVMITAEELHALPPDKVTSVRLTLRESDREWTSIEEAEGQVTDRLVPH